MANDAERRRALIATLEAQRKSTVIALFLSDRPGLEASLDDHTVRALYDHLRPLRRVRKLDLLLHTAGGDLEVPPRIVSLLREHADRVEMLVPAKAMSAASLLCLGADRLVLGAKAELSAFDAQIGVFREDDDGTIEEQIGVEDLMAYARFLRRRTGATDAALIATPLTQELPSWLLGRAERTHAQVRRLARWIMRTRRRPPRAAAMSAIIHGMAGRTSPHGHAIGRREARELGLPVVEPRADTDAVMWELHCAYETLCRSDEPFEPRGFLGEQEQARSEQVVLGCLESVRQAHLLSGEVRVARRLAEPERLAVTVNVGFLRNGAGDDGPSRLPDEGEAQRMRHLLVEALRPQLFTDELTTRLLHRRWRPVDGWASAQPVRHRGELAPAMQAGDT